VSFIALSVYGVALGTLTTRSGEFPSASAVYWRWKMDWAGVENLAL